MELAQKYEIQILEW